MIVLRDVPFQKYREILALNSIETLKDVMDFVGDYRWKEFKKVRFTLSEGNM